MKRIVFVFALLITSWSFASLTDGLVGYWPFDGDAKDYSGNGNHGVTHGVSLKADRDGRSNCAYSFGEGDYITVPANSQLNAISDFTLCALIKPSSWDNGYWLPIMCKGTTRQYGLEIVDDGCQDLIYHAEEELHVSIDHDYKSCFEFYYEGNGFLCTSHKLRLGEWTHIAATRSNGHLSVYINGTKIGSATGVNPPASDAGALNIGRDPPGGMEYFHGVMDELFLYNRALSSSEIFDLYNGALKVCKLTFDANGGSGTMPSLSVLSDTRAMLPANGFRRQDGYVFQGWATSISRANSGSVDYEDEKEIPVNSDMTLYAVWANPPLTLVAESADWSSGSITLRCEDADLNGAAHTYTLQYYDESTVEWKDVTSVQSASAGVSLTDTGFSSRLGGIPPVKYRVKDENGRVSEECVTRTRHGLFVAVDAHENGWAEAHSDHKGQADAFRRAYISYGGASGYLPMVLNGSNAKRKTIIDALSDMAEGIVAPGDVALFYYVGHGANGGLTCYDYRAFISASKLAECLHGFSADVGVVAIISSCHSASMIDTTVIDDEQGNIAWIVAAQADESTYCGAFQKTICDKGWLNGGADYHDSNNAGGNGDGYVTFGELALWGQQWTGKTYYHYRTLTDFWNYRVLDNIVAGRVPSHASVMPLTDGPTLLTAIRGKDGEINLEWTPVPGATGYDIYWRTKQPLVSNYVCDGTITGTRYVAGRTYGLAPNAKYEYHVRAVNDVYVSDASPAASCTPSENEELRNYAHMSALSTSSLGQSGHPLIEDGEVNYSNLNYDHDGDGFTTFEEYVAGTNPADRNDRFVASIEVWGGNSSVSWSPNLNTNGMARTYTIWGKTNLTDNSEWMSPTNSGHRFFKVTVEMP